MQVKQPTKTKAKYYTLGLHMTIVKAEFLQAKARVLD